VHSRSHQTPVFDSRHHPRYRHLNIQSSRPKSTRNPPGRRVVVTVLVLGPLLGCPLLDIFLLLSRSGSWQRPSLISWLLNRRQSWISGSAVPDIPPSDHSRTFTRGKTVRLRKLRNVCWKTRPSGRLSAGLQWECTACSFSIAYVVRTRQGQVVAVCAQCRMNQPIDILLLAHNPKRHRYQPCQYISFQGSCICAVLHHPHLSSTSFHPPLLYHGGVPTHLHRAHLSISPAQRHSSYVSSFCVDYCRAHERPVRRSNARYRREFLRGCRQNLTTESPGAI
jgi:hypothetical protein